MDADKLEMVRRAIEGVGVDLIKECYYQLEEFYRVGASVEEIIAHIDLAIQLREQLIKEKKGCVIQGRNVIKDTEAIATVLGIACKKKNTGFLYACLAAAQEYDVTMSRVELGGVSMVICRLVKDGKALSEGELEVLIERVKGGIGRK